MMSAVQAIEDANKEIHHGELADVLPVGSMGGQEGQPPPLPPPTLHVPHPLHQHHHQQHHQQQHHQQLSTSQSSHHHHQQHLPQQQQQQQSNLPQGVSSQQQHEPISPLPHHIPSPLPHQHIPSPLPHHPQLQHQSIQTQHSMDLDLDHPPAPPPNHPLPAPTPTPSTSSLQLHSQGVNTAEHGGVGLEHGGLGGMGLEAASSSHRAHLCTTCLKGFRSKQQLAQHSLVHTNIRKYTCAYCERAFKQLSHLQQHTRIHTGEKPYVCKYEGCDRAFAQLSNLQHHMRNHEEQVKKEATRLHKCLICHRSYTNESSLKAHTLKMHIHIKQVPPEGSDPDGQPVKKRRKKKNKQLYDAPTMVPLNSQSQGEHGDHLKVKTLSESSSDDDLVIIGDRRQQEFAAGMSRSLVESLNHYERTLAAGMTGRKVQDQNISSSNQAGSGALRGFDPGRSAATLGLQGLMGLPGIDPALMSSQPPEVIERAAAAAAAAVSSQLLQSGHGLPPSTSSQQQLPHPLPAHSQVSSTKGSGGGAGTSSPHDGSSRPSSCTPQPQSLSALDMMGGGQYAAHKPYGQIMDAHLRPPITLGPDQYYAHAGPPLGMLSPHARFLSPPMSYASHVSTAAPTATTSHLGLPANLHANGRPSDMGSPQHVSEALTFNS